MKLGFFFGNNMDTGLVQSGLIFFRLVVLKLKTAVQQGSRSPAGRRPSSSGIALNVIFNFIPEVLLVTQMMFCSLNIQRIVKIQKISK